MDIYYSVDGVTWTFLSLWTPFKIIDAYTTFVSSALVSTRGTLPPFNVLARYIKLVARTYSKYACIRAGLGFSSSCPPGTCSTALGATSAATCQLCPGGSYSRSKGSPVCQLCNQPGTYTTVMGAVNDSHCGAKACPAGTFLTMMGAGSLSDCVECNSPGFYSTAVGAGDVSACTNNACPPGTYYYSNGTARPTSSSVCIACARGTYSDAWAATACVGLCRPGS
jgi:hypothetical protein